ncbi:MAG: hypothetical protein R3B96_12535 [Pirellulaceae bacterium]
MVELVVVIGIDEAPEQFAGFVAHDPASLPNLASGLDLASRLLLGCRLIVFDTLLNWPETQGLRSGGTVSRQGEGRRAQHGERGYSGRPQPSHGISRGIPDPLERNTLVRLPLIPVTHQRDSFLPHRCLELIRLFT